MKSIKSLFRHKDSILRGIVISLAITSIAALSVIAIGFNQTRLQTNEYVKANGSRLAQSLISGNVVQAQGILAGLEKYGVDRSELTTDIFLSNGKRTILSGQLNTNRLAPGSTLKVNDNGLLVGKLRFNFDVRKVIGIVLDEQLIFLCIIGSFTMMLIIMLNAVFLVELKKIHASVLLTLNSNLKSDSEQTTNGVLSRLLFSQSSADAANSLISEIRRLRENEIVVSSAKAQARVAKQVAHDIRSPLSSLNLIFNKLSGEPDVKDLATSAISRLNTIAEDLLRSSRKGQTTFFSSTNQTLASSLRSLLNEYKMKYPNVSFDFESQFDSNTSSIQIKMEQINRIVGIILDNSVEVVSKDHGLVTLITKSSEHFFSISVRDNGPGIPENIIKEIGRSDITFGKPEGNGIGLSYVTEEVKRLNGNFEINSTPLIGTEVTVSLPRATSHMTLSDQSSGRA